MKKNLFVLNVLSCVMLFTSCENSKMTISPSHIMLHFEDEVGLTIIDNRSNVNWATDDEFVASVNNNGIVTAEHVGITTITAKNGKEEAYCSVSVTPEYHTYNEPIMDWGCSKQTIISRKGTPDSNQSNAIAYLQNESKGILEMYMFENGKLTSSGIILKLSYTNTDVASFLLERYQPITITDDGTYGFINAMTLEKANLMVALTIEDIILVAYGPLDSDKYNISSRCPAKSRIEEQEKLITYFYNQLLLK